MTEKVGCPHSSVVYCPLYEACHDGGKYADVGCDDGRLNEGGCAVSRGMDYHKEVARYDPERVQMLALGEMIAERNAQRKRNMRLLGVKA